MSSNIWPRDCSRFGSPSRRETDRLGAGYRALSRHQNARFQTHSNRCQGSNGILDGIAGDDFSGRSVSGTGDLNGDGIDDLIKRRDSKLDDPPKLGNALIPCSSVELNSPALPAPLSPTRQVGLSLGRSSVLPQADQRRVVQVVGAG